MAADRRPRPTRTDWQSVIPQVSDDWYKNYESQMPHEAPQEEPGFFDRTVESVKAVGEGLTFLPGGVVDTVQDVVFGFDPADKAEMAQRAQREQELQAYQQKYAGQAFEGVTGAMISIPYSAVTMGAGLAGGVAGGFAGPVGAGAAGMAASGTTAYRASKPQFQRTLYQATTESLGREPSPDEWGRVESNFEDAATRYGLWEAGPEAISNLLMVKILGPLGSKFKGGVKDVIKSVAGLYGEELATETITQMGQGAIEAEIGLRENAPGAVEAFKEVAPATFWQTTLMAGGKKGLDLAFRRTRGNGQAVEPDGPLVSEIRGVSGALALPSGERLALGPGQNIVAGMDSTGMDAIPMPHGPIIRPGETIDMLSLSEGLGTADFTVTPGGTAFSANGNSLPNGEAPITPYNTRPALTDYIDTDFRVVPYLPGVIPDQPQLPHGTGAIPMPWERAERPPQTPEMPLTGIRGVIMPPYTPRPALPQGVAGSSPQFLNSWSGGKSQLAYGPKPAPAMATPAPIPAAQQILNMQPTPRADTTAQAQALGIPAPDPMPAASALGAGAPVQPMPQVAGAPVQPMPQVPVTSATPTMPQTMIPPAAPASGVPTTGLPTSAIPGVAQQAVLPEQAPPVAQGQAMASVPNTRSAMLAQVSPENKQLAQKLEKKPLARLVATEQVPEPFSNVEWTREDYPLPTAQGGTVFTSGSGRKMTPFPVVDYSTPVKRKASNFKAAAWLLDETKKEAAGNQSFMRRLNALTPTGLPPETVNELAEMLTSGAPEEAPRILKPQSAPVQDTTDVQPKPAEAQDQPEGNAQTPTEQLSQEGYPKPKWGYGLPSFVTAQYAGKQKTESEHATATPASELPAKVPTSVDLSEHFARKLQEGTKYANIGQARRESFELTGKKLVHGTNDVKALDESIELGVVKAARSLITKMRGEGATDVDIFRRLVELYRQQPNLGVRTSTSVAQQAYSTPAPLAFLASHLAGITDVTTVYEPTAGNGMLIMEANPETAVVNELNADRAARLRSLGFTVTEEDAANLDPGKAVDVVIANPPFGRVRDDNRNPASWTVAGYETKELDHAIVLKALEALQPEGRAVLIVGGKQGNDDTRANKYQAAMQRQFYRALFDNYKVVDQFTVDGKLYERQGAGYPVDFIVIDGKGRSEGRKFPAADLPRIYNSFEALEGVIHEHRPQIHTGMDAAEGRRAADSSVRGRSGDQGRGGSDGATVPVDSAYDQSDRPGGHGRTGSGRDGHGAAVVSGGDVQPGSGREASGERGLSTDRHASDLRRQFSGTPRVESESGRGGVSEQDGGRQGNTRLSVESDSGRVGGTDANSVSGRELVATNSPEKSQVVEKTTAPKAKAQKATAHQEPYTPRSEAASMGTLVPRNMASPLKSALNKLEKRRGEIDGYVAKELGYSPDELKKYFAGEQIDAIGLAIDNISRGSGFIIGDQTGIGKGRVNAAIIRYAKQKGLVPVFVTMKPDLYADMIRDLNDIGESDFNPLPTNAGLTGEKAIPLPDGRKLRTGTAGKHEALMRAAADNSVADYDAVFTTYDQLNTVGSADTHRREFMRTIAPNALFILDESHNAGGSESGKTRKAKNAAPSRAEFIREILAASPHGAFYSSATYAKRPDVMSLYFKTDMRHAVDDMGTLADAISAGGIPLQQVVAAQLTESGQYIRRERSFEGASVEVTHAEAKMEHAEQSATIMRTILAFDTVKQKAMEAVKQDARGDGEDVNDSSATGEKGANSTNFTSIMHNLIGQSLLAMKAKAAAQEAAVAVQRGEKPVLTLANTMGSFIEEHVRGNGVQAGDELNLSFKDLFRRYLQKTRTLTKKDSSGKKVIESRLLTDTELGEEGVAAYNEVLQIIDGSVFDELPISPIDFITAELEQRGITVGEITGRTHAVEYRDGVPYYRARKTSSAQNIETMRRFNNGELDTMILNQSGSTGISLHSSSTFTDQRRRTMIIVQPELNIDVFMQTLGRVFRTGQVVPPSYKLLTSDIPAEKRPAAVLGKKMAGLNANTTASRTTDTTFQNIPDFLNEYGDSVTAQIMADEPELHAALGFPLKSKDKGLDREDAVRKVTGRIPMLPLKEQLALYERIEADYKELIAQLEATGNSALEAKSLALDAKLVESWNLTPAREDVDTASPFAAESQLGLFDVKVLGKPYTPEQVTGMVEKGKDVAPEIETVRKGTLDWLQNKLSSMENEEAQDNLKERVTGQFDTVRAIFAELPAGTPVLLNTAEASFEGVVTRHDTKGKGNPSAPSAWRITVAVADAAKQITVPYSKIMLDGSGEISVGGASIRPHPKSLGDVLDKFSSGQNVKREKRYIAFGNVLAAYAAVGDKGQVVNFEDSEGNTRAGILFRKDSERSGILGATAVSFPDFAAITRFFAATRDKAIVKSADGNLTFVPAGGEFKFSVPASKAKGAQFFLNGKLLAAAGQDFIKSGNTMSVRVGKDAAEKMVEVLREQGFGLVAGSHMDEARTVMGMDEKPKASLTDKPRSDDTPVRVVEVDPGIVPEFKKLGELVDWLKAYFSDRREETIESTGKLVRFTNAGLSASTKRTREAGHTSAYPALTELVRKAEYDGFEPNDIRHPNLGGQEAYMSAMRIGDKLYSVRLKFDVPNEAEIATRKKLYGAESIEDLRYKDHSLKEIQIAPIAENYGFVGHTATKAIREVNLGVLRGAVKPSSIENGVLSSLSPGEFLPPRRETRQRLRTAGVRRVADTLAKRAKNAVPTQVVGTFNELPARLRRAFAEQADLVEGVYYDGTVWLVAENLTDEGRAAEVWIHEQVGHHGVNRLFRDESEKSRTMNQFWQASGGMGNKDLAALTERYGLKPRTNIADRVVLMEEYIASVAEKMHRGTSLSSVEKSFWRRFVEAVKRLWARAVLAASGRENFHANVEGLLRASGLYVMDGVQSREAGPLLGGEALASVNEAVQGDAPRASLRDVLTSAKREQPGGISEAELAANPYLQSAMDKIGGDKPTLLERWESVKDNWKRRVEQGIFDQFAAINDVSQEGYRQARMTTSLGTQLQTMLHYGAPVWKEGAMSVQGKSLTDVFAPVADELDRYLRWMVGVRADRLKTEGRENLFAQEEIEALKGLNQGRTSADMSRQAVYKSVFNDFAEFKKRVLDFADEAGLIDPESRAVWENADYIPFYRLQERMDGIAAKGPSAGRGLTGQNSGVKRLKGGLENIGDPLENIMRNFAHMIDAAQKNRASVTILRDMERSGVAKRLSPVALHEELQVQGRALAEAMRQEFGTDSVMGPLSSKGKKAVLSLFTPSGGFVSCSVNGKPSWFSVSDPLLHRAMTNMRQTELRNNPIWKLFRKARSLLTTSVTAMPDFIVRNFLRDTLSVWAQEHRSGFTPLLDSVKQIKNVYSVDEDMRQLMASGAAFIGGGHRLGNNSEELSKELNKMLQRYKMDKTEFASSLLNTPKKLGNFLGKAWEQYERAGSAAENSSRLAVYKKLRAQGYSHAEASFAAKDLMDFSMRGEWEVVRTLTEVVPFLGARLAGLHRLGRGATENPRAFAFKGLTIAAASVALYALNLLANSDEWDKLEDWDRDSYFHFWIGGKHFRLPKPFEVGFVFGTVPERMVEQLMTDKPGRVLFSRIAHGALEQLSFNPVPQALTPVLEQAANRNFFRDRPIVSLGLDRKLPVDQYRETTSLTARHFATLMDTILSPMAGKTGLDTLRSPVRIEHLVEGYLGGLGSSLLGLSDVVLRSVTNAPSAPERRLEEMPFIRAFYRGSSENAERSRYETVLYDALSTADKLHSLIKGKQESGEEVQSIHSQLSDKELQVLAVRNGLRSTATALSNLNKQAERVRASTALTPSQKRAKLDKIQERKNGLAQRMVRRLEGKAA